ncbi:transcriptional regulator [Streptomyces somaliensis]|uniref:transcriptional regulator n=1 Tax=Streptomyces somaliensis TaxID=78355 RepID=UPI0020CC30D1|nr:transcriptional regulator [Streptomyces somaliensis]MCP9945081.1 transcriptional regulator [Streptomyces somaliensis]
MPVPSPSSRRPAPRRPAGDRSRRRVVLAVAAAAVVALTASAVLAGTLDSSTARGNLTVDNGHRAAPARPSLSVHPTGAVSSASPSSSPSSSSSSGTSSPSATASRTSTAPSLAARPGEHTAKRRRSGVPLTVDVRSHVWPHPCDQSYLVDRPPARVPPPPSPQDARGWVTALGGTPADRMMMELSVQGTSEEVVVLHALHVRIVEKGAPLPWTTYLMGDGCGGQMTPMSLDINLDAARPRVVPVAGQQGDREIPATDFPYKVSATDPQMLRVTAHTAGHSVRWYAELEWSSGDRRGTLLIDDRGRPFATSAAAGRPHYAYPLGGSGWLPVEYG